MRVTAIRTQKVRAGSIRLQALLDEHISELAERHVVAITSKIVSLCEGSVLERKDYTKDELVANESMYYLPAVHSQYGHHFTITNNTLIPMSGIDESNGDGHYVLWPKDPQAAANEVRAYLCERFGLSELGVVITDSTSQPMRRGTTGIALAHSGFKAVRDYGNTGDLFDRPYKVTVANISGGLAAAAVVAMGEGNEQTPLCVMSELDFVEFQDRDPTDAELQVIRVSLDDDLFAPFLQSVAWQRGKKA